MSEDRSMFMESTATGRMNHRQRPLHTFGVCFFSIAHKSYRKAQDYNGPFSSMTKKVAGVASLASPLVYAQQYLLLTILSFLDDRILALETTIEAIFPPSKYVFDEINEVVRMTEALPGKFYAAIDQFPQIIHQIPFLDRALVQAISWLNFWHSILVHWGSGTEKEKLIVVDKNCNESINESAIVQEADHENVCQNLDGNDIEEHPNPSQVSLSQTQVQCMPGAEAENVSPKCFTYKDALEKGTRENMRKEEDTAREEARIPVTGKQENVEKEIKENITKKEDSIKEENKLCSSKVSGEKEDKSANKMEETGNKDDPILALFESVWLMKPGKKTKDSSI